VAEPRLCPDRRAPGGQRELERRQRHGALAGRPGRHTLPPAHRGRMGIRRARRHAHALSGGRRPRRAAGQRQHLRPVRRRALAALARAGRRRQRRLRLHRAGGPPGPQRLRPARHDRQRVGMGGRLVRRGLLRPLARGRPARPGRRHGARAPRRLLAHLAAVRARGLSQLEHPADALRAGGLSPAVRGAAGG
jgi:hypothetical protein